VPSAAGRIGKLKERTHLIKIRTGDIPPCSIVLQPLRYCVPTLVSLGVKIGLLH
jgi:hypothetical protein